MHQLKNIEGLKQKIMTILDSVKLDYIAGWSYEGCEESYCLEEYNGMLVVKFNKLGEVANVKMAVNEIKHEAEKQGFICSDVKITKNDMLFKVTIQIAL